MQNDFFDKKSMLKERKLIAQGKYNSKIRRQKAVETIVGWSFMAPLLLVAVIFVTVAIILAIILTFYSGNLGSFKFVGLGNWKNLFSDSQFALAIKNTFWYASITTSLSLVFSLALSIVINTTKIKFKKTFMAIYFLPQLTSGIAVTFLFKFLVSPHGLIQVDYYADSSKLMWVVIISAIWGGTFGGIITYNTAFAGIDRSQYEAATLDGAVGLKKALFITLPSLSPIISYSLMMGIIGGLGVFDGPYMMAILTGKSPNSMVTLAYLGFGWILSGINPVSNVGYGTTILFFLGLLIATMTAVGNFVMPLNRRTY